MHTVPALGSGVRPRPVLQTEHLSVLGGRTLNVAVVLPRQPAGLAAARLELVRGSRRMSLELVMEPQRDGTLLLTATAPLLHAGPGERDTRGLAVGTGIWRFTVVTVDTAGRETRADLAAPALSTIDGPTLPTSPSTSSGAVFRPVRSVDGRAMLKVSAPAQQAELLAFDLRFDRITVHGRLISRRHPVTDYTAEAVRRGTTKSVPVQAVWDGDDFTFDIPLAAMTARQSAQRTWDFQLRAGRTRLKLARRLTHVRNIKDVFRTPFTIVALEDGSLARVHAHLTPSGALAVACAAFGTNEDA
ncbi:hypothetical protein NMG29_07780 [Streptomyces cocklensis]|jgi:hypothetical protein|uniref:Uncharacterized protein n=1 Tax=Actinacidiphila cocklensis TaxID=887465 RepID=A0A9W4DKN3_9ACTN|nr:hypothetical protein [Actinacidiphila cocklensis]MDD1058126.1 hypothetical protein [Actinacidiphila cocklensis]WSX79454.1 hypothetical protein OH826_39770 [Streptomyces sp. NBC_00899]CAG6393166.1 conserved hypothetical protein [Actinacidiphila cocklensis]